MAEPSLMWQIPITFQTEASVSQLEFVESLQMELISISARALTLDIYARQLLGEF
jgi:hypothetical protein